MTLTILDPTNEAVPVERQISESCLLYTSDAADE